MMTQRRAITAREVGWFVPSPGLTVPAFLTDVAPDESLASYEDDIDEDDLEDMEPLLKFKRVEGSLSEVFAQDLATCLAVHARHLVLFRLLSSVECRHALHVLA